MYLEEEDYIEPHCPFCKKGEIKRIPLGRIFEKSDEYLSKNDFPSAKRHLNYWLTEAKGTGDKSGELSLINEFIGLSRKLGEKENAFDYIEKALELVKVLNFTTSVTGATTYLNVATAFEAFKKTDDALDFYEKATAIYEKELSPDDSRLAGLYNNTALALQSKGEFLKSKKKFLSALNVLSDKENSQTERAITYVNLANLIFEEKGSSGNDEILEYMLKAKAEFDACTVKDGNYAYALTKCADAFRDFGYDDYAKNMLKIARDIYERS